MSPETFVDTTATALKESAEITAATLKPLTVPFLRAFTWILDGYITQFDVLKPLQPVTGYLKYKAWESEYKKQV